MELSTLFTMIFAVGAIYGSLSVMLYLAIERHKKLQDGEVSLPIDTTPETHPHL